MRRNIVTSYGRMRLSDADADELIKSVDADGDEMIDYEEFITLFTGKGLMEP